MSKPLTIEIHGTGTHNRGAELMAIAIADRLRSFDSRTRIAVSPSFGTLESIEKYAFLTVSDEISRRQHRIYKLCEDAGTTSLMPHIASAASIVCSAVNGKKRESSRPNQLDPREIDLVIDASGFNFSDQWGPSAARSLWRKMKVSRHKKQLILLPQAFGPFVNKDVAKWCKALIDRSALCFPRDKTSFSNVVNLVGKSKKVVQFPDFTLAVSPSEDACLSASGRVLVVPNYRMLDKRDANLDYITFLVRAFALIRAKGLDPAFLIHDAVEDLRIVDLARNEGLSAEVISHDDPRVLKKLLAEASFVIGSRFHSLVSALSQSTPCIGCGWSHKYKELFSDFECPEMLLEDFGNHDSLVNKVNALTCAAGRAEAVSNIQNATRALKIKVDTMWELVESVLASASGKGLTAKR